jgi:hypothetical protein
LTVGILDAARLFASFVSLTNGVREAALYAGSGSFASWCSGDGADIACPAASTGHLVLNPDNIAYHIQGESSGMDLALIALGAPVCDGNAAVACSASSTTVTITATYPFKPLTPIVGVLLGNTITLRASTTAQIQK